MAKLLATLISLLWIARAFAGVTEIDRLRVPVADLDRTEAFYRDALGFRTLARATIEDEATQRLFGVADPARSLTMQLGAERVEFVQFRVPGRPYPADSQSPDLWFQHFAIVVSDMDAAYARLRSYPFQAISVGGPQTLPKENGGVRAFKFRDPDGHPLELLYFPPGQGRPRWAVDAKGKVGLGLDHTAIGVSSTAASRRFYGDLLGMKVAYEVINRGPRQEALDGVFDARVRITGLRAASTDGPGVEFLDYRSPPTGRRERADSVLSDIWRDQIVFRADDLDALAKALDEAEVRFVSPGVVSLDDHTRAIAVLDPDGHAIEIVQ